VAFQWCYREAMKSLRVNSLVLTGFVLWGNYTVTPNTGTLETAQFGCRKIM
jgi:hypothetical protein